MSNPSGTDRDEPAEAADTGHPADPPRESPDPGPEPITEVIEAAIEAADVGEVPGDPAQRRYTAPGFDAGSTQVIDRVPDAPTQVFTGADTHAPQLAAPQAIPPAAHRRPRRRRLLIVAGAASALILGAAVLVYAILTRATQEDRVRTVIQTFDSAVQSGDLATLRAVTCGQTHDAYAGYDEGAWADAYAKISSAKQYPVVASVDDVVVNGDHAEANVTSYMAFDPATTATRSFDLYFSDDQWKICQAS